MALWDRARWLGAVLSLAGAGGLVVYAFVPRAAARAPAPELSLQLAGAPVPADLAAFAQHWESEPMALAIESGPDEVRSRAAWGAHVDLPALSAALGQARDARSWMRAHAQAQGRHTLDLELPIVFDPAVSFDRLADLKDRFDRGPRDARANPRTREISTHQDGRTLDVHGTLDALEAALRASQSRAVAQVSMRPARRTASELAEVRMDAVLGFFETRYNNGAEARDRLFNLGVAASKIDGLVLLPNEELDFNAVVGPRSQANGFRPAPVIAQGELVDGVGGGTCQIAGTLHAAAFFAGLPITARNPHSRPSTYVFMGLDAVVAYPQLNLRLRNDRAFPIVIGATVQGGIVRVELRGASNDRMVTFVRRVDEVLPFEAREVADSSLPAGVRVLRQRGVPGFRIHGWRIVRDVTRNQALRTHFADVYPPTSQIWRVGSGGAMPEHFEAPPGDDHPEYTADEYLSVTQGAGVNDIQIIRRGGRSAVPGWTEAYARPAAR